MKHLLFVLLSLVVFSASAQVSFKTGSTQLDADLNSINATASVNFGFFKDDLSHSHHASAKKIDYMHGSLNMAPGEIYLAFEISILSRKPIDEVITIYSNNKDKGWGYIAKQAGIKPGSAAFHQMKNNARGNQSSARGNNGRGNGNSNGKGKGKGKKG